MKNWIIIFVISVPLFSHGQNKRTIVKKSTDSIDYTNTKTLAIVFDSIQKNLQIDWNKFKQLNKLSIYNYSSDYPITLKGLDKGSFNSISIAHSDYTDFFKLNKLPKKIQKLWIWNNRDYADILTIPKEIGSYKKLRYFSIGCCLPLDLKRNELDRLKKLDTLILEAPLIDSNQLEGLHRLKYLGIWSSTLNNSKEIIDSLLPNTEKEGWCFPPNQRIKLFNGHTKFVKDLKQGDTLSGFDSVSEAIIPSIITNITIHKERYYPVVTLGKNNLLASTDYYNTTSSIVTCTANHPVHTDKGAKRIDEITLEDLIYHLNEDNETKVSTIDDIETGIIKSEVYDIKSTTGNYFINGLLILNK